jgi:hypothetical protein
VLQCPSDITVSTALGRNTAVVTYSPTATDACGPVVVTCVPPSGSTFALGTTVVTCQAKDAAGNVASCSFNVTVRDTESPVVKSVTATPSVLNLNNHTMVAVYVTVSATDNSGSTTSRITRVTSNEPENGTGDGDTAPDSQITGALTLNLRAERAQNGKGRTYTIYVDTADAAGNVVTRTTTVFVPKN